MDKFIDWQDMSSRMRDIQEGEGEGAAPTYTIATLPSGAKAKLGMRAIVSNGAASPVFLGALGTPATTKAPVWYNGTAWVYG